MKTAFIICSRKDSSRVPSKAFINYNGLSHLEHLIERLLETEIPIYVAVPEGEEVFYSSLMDKYPKRVFISAGFANDPLRRMYGVAKQNEIENIIRITHDKIFVDPELIFQALGKFNEQKLDYLYSSSFIPGTGFEIISYKVLEQAAASFKKVEHVSYAIKAITENKLDFQIMNSLLRTEVHPSVRLLVDYPEDVQLMKLIFATLGKDCRLQQVIEFMADHPWVSQVNRLPKTTVYTCAYNAEKWITEAMGSVAMQENFADIEYILIDDHSSDRTAYLMAKFCQLYKNAQWHRNNVNMGLASSSNRALKMARGKYIVRLDADDYFANNSAIVDMIEVMEERNLDAVYPNNYLGIGRREVQSASDHHHVGGSLFRTSAVNHVKFTEGLRNFEGLDFFGRAQKQLNIGYLAKPVFVYRQHDGSMSKTNLDERQKTREAIMSAMTGGPLITKQDIEEATSGAQA